MIYSLRIASWPELRDKVALLRGFVVGIVLCVAVVADAPTVMGDAGESLAALKPGDRSTVVEIVDGDTVLLADGREVRLVGIQAPKLPLGRLNSPKWPLADMAKEALASLVLGQEVSLRYGGRETDRHGRQLAHLVMGDGRWVQGIMLHLGLARVYSFADNRALVAEMLEEERAARAARMGIWANPYYAIRDQAGTRHDLGTFQLVEGRVFDASESRGTVYLNFGDDWRSDFTVMIRRQGLELFRRSGFEPLELAGRPIRVRGWLDNRNGPMIEATHPEQIELLDN